MVFAAVAVLVAGGITVLPRAACPSQATVAAEIDRLGARPSLAEVGNAEVAVRDGNLRIMIRDGAGGVLGSRIVPAPVDCESRAKLAAVLIAAWTGDWIKTNFGSQPRPTVPPAPQVSLAAQAQGLAEQVHIDVGAFGFGIHDGDAGAVGGGVQAGLRWHTLGLAVVAEGSSDRQRALGPAYARYSFLRAGAGLSARRQWSRTFADVVLVPEIVRYALSGVGLSVPRGVASWNLCADLRFRFGLSFGRISPFAYVGASWTLLKDDLRVYDGTDSTALPRANLAAGLGISLTLH
jgi:hypothetical protein